MSRSQGLGVSVVETFDEQLGGDRPPTGRAGFDPGGFVDFVAEGGDFAATDGGDPTDVEGRAPVQTKTQRDIAWLESASVCDVNDCGT